MVFHRDIILLEWKNLIDIIENGNNVILTGDSLEIAQVVATAR